jgi:hypothetical protein
MLCAAAIAALRASVLRSRQASSQYFIVYSPENDSAGTMGQALCLKFVIV